MMPVETAFGFVGALFFLVMIYFSRKSLNHFRDHRDVSLVKFFIDERGGKAFKFLAITAFVYAIAMMVTGMEFLYGSQILLVSSRGLILGVAVMLMYFIYEVSELTAKNPEEE